MNVANKLKNSVKVIDLSHEIYNEMPGWPTHPVFRIYSLKNIEIDGYNIKEILMNTHHGTHLDLPVHMIKNGKKLEDYPIDKFIGEGVVINLSHKKPITVPLTLVGKLSAQYAYPAPDQVPFVH